MDDILECDVCTYYTEYTKSVISFRNEVRSTWPGDDTPGPQGRAMTFHADTKSISSGDRWELKCTPSQPQRVHEAAEWPIQNTKEPRTD